MIVANNGKMQLFHICDIKWDGDTAPDIRPNAD